jgi:hypothetical protein
MSASRALLPPRLLRGSVQRKEGHDRGGRVRRSSPLLALRECLGRPAPHHLRRRRRLPLPDPPPAADARAGRGQRREHKEGHVRSGGRVSPAEGHEPATMAGRLAAADSEPRSSPGSRRPVLRPGAAPADPGPQQRLQCGRRRAQRRARRGWMWARVACRAMVLARSAFCSPRPSVASGLVRTPHAALQLALVSFIVLWPGALARRLGRYGVAIAAIASGVGDSAGGLAPRPAPSAYDLVPG